MESLWVDDCGCEVHEEYKKRKLLLNNNVSSVDIYDNLKTKSKSYGGSYKIIKISNNIIRDLGDNIKFYNVETPIIYDPIKCPDYDIYVETLISDIRHYQLIDTNDYGNQIYMVLYGKSIEYIDEYIDHVTDKYRLEMVQTGRIKEWSNNYGYIDSKNVCNNIKYDDLVGLDDNFNKILTDIDVIQQKQDLLAKLGMTNGYNYLLYGPPGTGKTSSIKVLAHKLKVPVYVIKMGSITSNNYSKAFYPPGNGLKLILIEDFDRYLNSNDDVKSELLNVLDGIYNSFGVIRFFSANTLDNIFNDDALSSRMNRMLYYDLPEIDTIKKHLNKVFPDFSDDIDKLCDIMPTKVISIRRLNQYIGRFVLDDNPVQSAIDNLGEWLTEIKK